MSNRDEKPLPVTLTYGESGFEDIMNGVAKNAKFTLNGHRDAAMVALSYGNDWARITFKDRAATYVFDSTKVDEDSSGWSTVENKGMVGLDDLSQEAYDMIEAAGTEIPAYTDAEYGEVLRVGQGKNGTKFIEWTTINEVPDFAGANSGDALCVSLDIHNNKYLEWSSIIPPTSGQRGKVLGVVEEVGRKDGENSTIRAEWVDAPTTWLEVDSTFGPHFTPDDVFNGVAIMDDKWVCSVSEESVDVVIPTVAGLTWLTWTWDNTANNNEGAWIKTSRESAITWTTNDGK